MAGKQISLNRYFQNQASKWGLVGLIVTLGFAIPFVVSEIKSASEERLIFAAKNLSDVYRDDIIDHHFRSVEDQIGASLKLKDGEGAVILDRNFKPSYDSPRSAIYPCHSIEKVCWNKTFDRITYLQPVYFDPVKKEGLKAYLQLTITPILNWSFVAKFSIFLLFGYIVQAWGMISALRHCAKMVKDSLSRWTSRLSAPADKIELETEAPFIEMEPTQRALDNLPNELARLEHQIQRDSKFRAQLSIVRQVGHDIGTPVSQLARYWELLAEDLNFQGIRPGEDGAGIDRALARIREMILNLQTFNQSYKNFAIVQGGAQLSEEVQHIAMDLNLALDLPGKKIEFCEKIEKIDGPFFIPKTDLYRIIENLLRNSVEAFPVIRNAKKNTVTVGLTPTENGALLKVADNGVGIPESLQNQIFDPDITTKESRGTGLGLAFVKDKCLQLGADLSFESSELGTTFLIQFKRSELLKAGNYGSVSGLSS
jgi:signal transduction histidine kinase